MKKILKITLEPLKYIRTILYSIYYKINKPDCFKLNIMTDIETLELINKKKLSVCRYGDGEFNYIFGKFRSYNEKNNNPILSKKLEEVLKSNNDKVLICVPEGFRSISKFRYESRKFWIYFINHEWKNIAPFLSKDKIYGNANISRPYIIYNRNERKKSEIKFNKLKQIWDNKDILILEGSNTKLGVGNNLLDNAKSISRILCPDSGAFNAYDKIISETKKIAQNKVILLALGPTATVLAYDLCLMGYQAIDIGHIDLEYEWFKRKSKKKELIAGKNNNEIENGYDNVSNILNNDVDYKNSIRSIIK